MDDQVDGATPEPKRCRRADKEGSRSPSESDDGAVDMGVSGSIGIARHASILLTSNASASTDQEDDGNATATTPPQLINVVATPGQIGGNPGRRGRRGPPPTAAEQAAVTLAGKVDALLTDPGFGDLGRGCDRREMIARANKIGGPPLRLIPLAAIEAGGGCAGPGPRLPQSSDGIARDALDLIAEHTARKCEIFFLSHRWLQPGHPDDDDNSKAKALVEFGRWRRAWIRQTRGFEPVLLFWIDVGCVDQAQPGPDLIKLPLAIACCERLLTFVADGYRSRGWCRIEQLLAKRFMFADHQAVIGMGYRSRWPYTGRKRRWTLCDPTKGALTCDADRIVIRQLVRSANAGAADGSSVRTGGSGSGATSASATATAALGAAPASPSHSQAFDKTEAALPVYDMEWPPSTGKQWVTAQLLSGTTATAVVEFPDESVNDATARVAAACGVQPGDIGTFRCARYFNRAGHTKQQPQPQ